MNSKEDAELVHSARAGNRDAYGELIRRYQRPMWGLASEVLPALEDIFREQTIGETSMLHITDGESVAGTLRESGIPGTVVVYLDLMSEGPTPAGLDAETWRETRARFWAEPVFEELDEARRSLKARDDALAAYSQYDEVVMWFDHKLSNQLMLIRALDWLSRQDLGAVKLSLIGPGQYPGIDHFYGLGQLTADQLASLADTRLLIREVQIRTAQAAWKAFTSPDPMDIQRLLETDTSALPFLAAGMRRHLEQFPSVDNGLSRTERQALTVLRDQGSLEGPWLFVAVQRMEELIFMGDTSFYRIVGILANARHPLVQISDTPRNRLGNVTITETGRKVLEGQADHIDLNGIDEWRGGVHLKGDKAAWRWDRASERIAADRPRT